MRLRGWALCVTVGAGLAVLASVLHPPTFDPADPGAVQAALAAAPRRWLAVHGGFAAGVSLWTAGLLGLLAAAPAAVAAGAGLDPAAAAATAAWALWLGLMAFEAAGLPRLAAAPAGPSLAAAWASTLATGYAAGVLDWLALWALASRLAAAPGVAGAAGRAGWVAVPPGIAGQLLAWAWPEAAVPLLLLTLGPGVLWSVVAGWALAGARGAS